MMLTDLYKLSLVVVDAVGAGFTLSGILCAFYPGLVVRIV